MGSLPAAAPNNNADNRNDEDTRDHSNSQRIHHNLPPVKLTKTVKYESCGVDSEPPGLQGARPANHDVSS